MNDDNTWRCAVPECDRPKSPKAAKGMCKLHYDRAFRESAQLRTCDREGCDRLGTRRFCGKHRPASPSSKTKPQRNRFRRYGLTPADFDKMVDSQGGGCAVCGVTPADARHSLVVDHDHSCCPGRDTCGSCIRGVLCRECNVGLGHLRDDPELLLTAHRYLTR